MMILFILGLFIIDRLIKFYVVSGENYIINKGVALGLFGNYDFLGYLLFPVVVILLAVLWQKFKQFRLPLVLIYAGAASNLIDRLLYNGVVDYISIWIIPVFNISDMMIVTGIVLLLVFEIKNYAKDTNRK